MVKKTAPDSDPDCRLLRNGVLDTGCVIHATKDSLDALLLAIDVRIFNLSKYKSEQAC